MGGGGGCKADQKKREDGKREIFIKLSIFLTDNYI